MMAEDMTEEERWYLALGTCAVCVCLAVFVSFTVRRTVSPSTQYKKSSTHSSSDGHSAEVNTLSDSRPVGSESLAAWKGQKCAKEGKIEEALNYLTEAIALNSGDFASVVCRSGVYFEKFKISESSDANANLTSHFLLLALQDADTAITLCPDQDDGYLCKISILRSISEVIEAKTLCAEGLKRVPQSTALAAAASAMQGESDYDEAAEFRKILEAGLGHSHSHDHNHDHRVGDFPCPLHPPGDTHVLAADYSNQPTRIERVKRKGTEKNKGKKKKNKKK